MRVYTANSKWLSFANLKTLNSKCTKHNGSIIILISLEIIYAGSHFLETW
jgi:hypothetical protein